MTSNGPAERRTQGHREQLHAAERHDTGGDDLAGESLSMVEFDDVVDGADDADDRAAHEDTPSSGVTNILPAELEGGSHKGWPRHTRRRWPDPSRGIGTVDIPIPDLR